MPSLVMRSGLLYSLGARELVELESGAPNHSLAIRQITGVIGCLS